MSLILQLCFIFLLPIFTVVADHDKATQACFCLFLTLPPGRVLFPGSAAYNSSMSLYAYAETRLLPKCFAAPERKEEVSKIIEILGRYQSVGFAIKSGGHSINTGFANIANGVTIDLRGMNAVQLNQDKTVVSIGAGNRWQDVYDALDPHGLSVQGGRVASVGVGGLITGGGIGYFSPQLGWVCDSIVNFEVVLSNGAIVNANATSHSDLYAALKGGQNNFGIVTRFDSKILVYGSLWGGIILYSNATNRELLDTFTNYKDPAKFDAHAMVILIFMYNSASNAFGALSGVYHARPDLAKGSSLEAFAKIQPQLHNTVRTASPGSFAKEMSDVDTSKAHMSWATTTFAINPTILPRIHNRFQRTCIRLKASDASLNFASELVLQSVPAVAPESSNSLGFDPSSHPELNLVNVLVIFSSEEASALERLEVEVKKFLKEIDGIAEEEGVKRNHIYLNYAGAWQDVFAGYGKKSLESMRAVAKKYDEMGMFQSQVRGGFKLFG